MKLLSICIIALAFLTGVFINISYSMFSNVELSSEKNPNSLGTCQCQIGQSPENTIETEVESKCSTDRLYFQKALKKINPVFLEPRPENSGQEFPVSCVGYIMRKFIDASSRASRYYSYCAQAGGGPVRPKKTHCITPEYVQSVYNSYVDVLDCLDIPQKDLLPKLFNESGMHINTLGSGMDAGVGQLTSPAIASVQQVAAFDGKNMTWLEMFKEEIAKSTKPSCERILKIPNLFKKVSDVANQRCVLIAVPENPMKNVLYTGIFYHYMLRSQTGSRYFKGKTFLPQGKEYVEFDSKNLDLEFQGFFAEYKIKARLVELGITQPNMQAMRQMMITLGYNAGMESAFIFLDRYLKARKQVKLNLKESDFDFQKHFASKLFKKSKDAAVEKQRIKELNLAKSAPYRLPFPIFLRVSQKTGTPGYLSAVANKLLILDKEMGEGQCTTPNFLKL